MVFVRLVLYILGLFLLVVLTQDLQIFPGVLFSLFKSNSRDPSTLPQHVESVFVGTDDDKRLEVWRLPANTHEKKLPYVGLVFHGNGGSLESFLELQLWFSHLGITSYGFDYRGFGRSSGWPSEQGLGRDGDAVWSYVLDREHIDASQVIVFGYSMGGAPAARIASLHQPKVLILSSSFTDLRQAIREQGFVGFLAPLAWYRLPTIDYVRKLDTTDLILAHGQKDTLVLPYHLVKLHEAYQGRGFVEKITSADAGHNDLFFGIQDELADALRKSLEIEAPEE